MHEQNNKQNKNMRKYIYRSLLAAVTLYCAMLAWLYFNQRSLLFFPEKDIKDISHYQLGDAEDLRIVSRDGTNLQLWHKEPTSGKPMTIYLHGNSFTLGQHAPQFRQIMALGYGFIAPAYPGFSRSAGTPSKEAILAAAKSAVDFAQSKGYRSEDIILIGESLGSGVATHIASEHQFGGVFLITPYTSIADRAQEIYWYIPAQYLVTDNFSSLDKIHLINAPLLMVHGTNDTVIPHAHSHKLVELAHEPKKLVIYEGKGHNNLDYEMVYKEMDDFFSHLLSSKEAVSEESLNTSLSSAPESQQ